MPIPAVYVLAVIGTVGAVIVFKEFVYQPHIAPQIGKWKMGFQAAREDRKRRRAAVMDGRDEHEVPMEERQRSQPTSLSGKRRGGKDDDHDSDDQDAGPSVWGSGSARQTFLKDGLLVRRRAAPGGARADKDDGSSIVELDNLVAREISEWSREDEDLRARKNGHAMDESINSIPYVPLSPNRTHVLFDSASASPATTGGDASRLPSEPTTPAIRPVQTNTISTTTGAGSAGLLKLQEPLEPTRAPQPLALLPSSTTSSWDNSFASSEMRRSVSEGQHGSQVQTLANGQSAPAVAARTLSGSPFGNSSALLHLANVATAVAQAQPPQAQQQGAANGVAYPYPRQIPSLSQSYPQDLDYEHGLELLSPPSSRSDSPFSMADASSPANALGRLNVNPRSSSALSGASYQDVASPSPLRMELGDESFDTLSPVFGHHVVDADAGIGQGGVPPFLDSRQPTTTTTTVSPFLDPPVHHHGSTTPLSMSSSTRSSTYHSFAESGDEDEDDDDVPLAARRVSLSLSHSRQSSASSSGHNQNESQGLGLTFVPASPLRAGSETFSPLSIASSVSSVAPATGGQGPPRRLPRPTNGNGILHTPAQSDSELSDLDLLSDYAMSEGEGELVSFDASGSESGQSPFDHHAFLAPVNQTMSAYESDRESDASWSVAGGSESDVGFGAESPRVGGVSGVSGAMLSRGGTLRGMRNGTR